MAVVNLSPFWHFSQKFILGGCSLFLMANIAVAKPPKLTSVADLRYGVALYHYYEADYMNALSELLVADARDGIKGHGDNPKIMEGGFALAYGLEEHASEIFERLLEQNRSVNVRDSAWFYLAKMRYKSADYLRAQEAVDQISSKPPKIIKADIDALRINLLIREKKLTEANILLDSPGVSDYWRPYIYFNLGSAWAREKNYAQAVYFFNRVGDEFYSKNEHRAIYDKAMTAAGYSNIFRERYPEAISEFSKVRLTSGLSNRALLGYGWAAVKMGDYQGALVPWQHLATSSLIDENSQEALIAVPFAYEKLGADGLALSNYQEAVRRYLGEIERLDNVMQNLNNDGLLATLQIKKSAGFDWLNYAEENQLSPRLAYLAPLFSREEFQLAVQDLRDLLASKEMLLEWLDKLDFYSEMLDDRSVSRAERAAIVQAPELKSRLNQMKKQRSMLAQNIEIAIGTKDYFSFSQGNEKKLLERVQRIASNIELLGDDPFIDEYQESYRKFHGLLLWQASEAFSERLWSSVKDLNQLDENIAAIDATLLRIDNILNSAPEIDPARLRIRESWKRINKQVVSIDAAIAHRQDNLGQQLLDILQNQRSRLSHYLAQSRLSVARIYDKGNSGEQR